MKILFIQIPCLNEQSSIAKVLKSIPKNQLLGLGLKVKILIIDDGSKDKSAQIAKSNGADYIISHNRNLGLAYSFTEGINFCLKNDADFIVNLDGDNQYDSSDLIKVLKPILKEEADMVIGDRQIEKLDFMPLGNKIGNRIGSWAIGILTGEKIPDASSGFRAFTKNTVLNFNLHSTHTYTHETIIQSHEKNLKIISIPVNFRKRQNGNSRLINGLFTHIRKSVFTIIRTIMLYQAFKYLFSLGIIIIFLGTIEIVRFLYFFSTGQGTGHIQSLVLASGLIILGVIIIVLGIIADLISVNRKNLEEIRLKLSLKK